MAADRAGYIAGLRKLADVLEGHPEVPLPSAGQTRSSAMSIPFYGGTREEMAAAKRAIPVGTWSKEVWDGESGSSYFELTGRLEGLSLKLATYRDQVCTRVVTGTREVTKTVKDPDALAQVSEVEITETVEDIRWDCGPLLAPAASEPQAAQS
jgi:hypothetical protein